MENGLEDPIDQSELTNVHGSFDVFFSEEEFYDFEDFLIDVEDDNICASKSVVSQCDELYTPKNEFEEKDNTNLLKAQFKMYSQFFRCPSNADWKRIESTRISLSSDSIEVLNSQEKMFSPVNIGLMPSNFWELHHREISIREFISLSLQNRRTKNTRFEYRIYNILRLTLLNPDLVNVLGASWVNDEVFFVMKEAIADILNISRCANGALFNRQGNFPCHGFIECVLHEGKYIPAYTKRQRTNPKVIFFMHKNFSPLMKDGDFDSIRYKNEYKKNYGHREIV